MELHAFDRKLPVAQTHHQPVLRLRRHLEHSRYRLALDHERVIARRGERARKTREHTGAVVANLRRLAVHHVRRSHDPAAVELQKALDRADAIVSSAVDDIMAKDIKEAAKEADSEDSKE